MLNKVTLIGNLGKDPESKQLQGGDTVCNFSIATTEKYMDKAGNKVEQTEWHNIVAWRKLAEIAAKYLKKGSKVYVEGKIKTRSWEQNGEKKYATDIEITQMIMLGGKEGEVKAATPYMTAPAPMAAAAQDDLDDGMPF